MAVAEELAAVRERDVQGDHEVAVARRVERTTGHIAAFDEPREGHRGELALGVRLVQAGPESGALRGVLADRERVEELEPPGIREDAHQMRGALVRLVIRSLEQRRIAVKEIAIPVDHRAPRR